MISKRPLQEGPHGHSLQTSNASHTNDWHMRLLTQSLMRQCVHIPPYLIHTDRLNVVQQRLDGMNVGNLIIAAVTVGGVPTATATDG